ncbi:hypothetical protein ACN38_g12777, partial [Penicillium nordicum]
MMPANGWSDPLNKALI